jgi:glyoxylase-like metal-dependent hydrolase (beta-lactamase superfamily II)
VAQRSPTARDSIFAGIDAAPGRPDILRIVAPNPGPMTLEGTNTYLVGRDPAYVIDPGPALDSHVEAVLAAGAERGGIAGILLTHSHSDHSAAVPALEAPLLWGEVSDAYEGNLTPAPVVLPGRPTGAVGQDSSGEVGPFAVVRTPGHATDHSCFVLGDVCFCGDLVLGHGSAIVPPAAMGGSLRDYMASLERVSRLGARLLCPGHGPWITEPAPKLAEYAAHREDRGRKLVAAIDRGERDRERLLDAAWGDVPLPMRPAAALAMQAHLEELDAEGRLPPDLTA